MHDGDEERLDLAISRATGRSRAFVQVQIAQGRVSVDGVAAAKPSQKVSSGARIDCTFEDAPPSKLTPVAADLNVLYEDADLLVIDKASHLTVHPAPGTHGPTLVHHLLHHLGKAIESLDPARPGIVHRLDRGTSGCIVVAKNRPAQEKLSAQFKDRVVKKVYEAIAWGALPERGIWESVVGRDRTNRKKMSRRTDQPRDALTGYERRQAFRHAVQVRLFPKTGRTHQLRVHLTENGNPIVGDELYGGRVGKRALAEPLREILAKIDRPLLHAAELSIDHPVSCERMTFQAPLPADFRETLAAFVEYDT